MACPRPSPPPPQKPMPMMDLEVTVVSAKHLKNVNWRNGDLKPYAVAYIDPDRRSATKPDESTKPVWNERLLLPLPLDIIDGGDGVVFTLDVFHSKPSETPRPLVGTARLPLRDLVDLSTPSVVPARIKTLELRRPSGRPHGKVRIKTALRERPVPSSPPPPSQEQNYHRVAPPPPPSGYYYSTALLPPPMMTPRDYRTFSHSPPPLQYPYSGSYSDPYSSSGGYGYYSSPHHHPPLPAARPLLYYDRPPVNYGSGPSAPADYTSSYEQKGKGGTMGMGLGAGLAVGAVAGALGGLALDGGIKYEEDKIAERVESDLAARDDYRDYHDSY